MQTVLKTAAAPALLGLLLILPLVILEVANRRGYHEGFPFFLFFVIWFNLFAILLILLPLARSRSGRGADKLERRPAHTANLLANPVWSAVVCLLLALLPFMLAGLDALGLFPLDRLVNGPDPAQPFWPGLFISILLFALPVASGVIAGSTLADHLRAGGSLLARPVHLLIVAGLVAAFAFGLGSLIIDQWPCFMGVPVCD